MPRNASGMCAGTWTRVPGAASTISSPACSSSDSSRTMRMPLPPPPALAFTITGSPISLAKAMASSSLSAWVVPGTMGTPAFDIVWRAVTLSPMARITSPLGPMKTTPSFPQRSAKPPFSARKP